MTVTTYCQADQPATAAKSNCLTCSISDGKGSAVKGSEVLFDPFTDIFTRDDNDKTYVYEGNPEKEDKDSFKEQTRPVVLLVQCSSPAG